MQAYELTVSQAINDAPKAAQTLQQLAVAHRQQHTAIDQYQTIRHWLPDAGTFCYQTHIGISGQPKARLSWLADIFYNTAKLEQLPWYPQFQRGAEMLLSQPPLAGIEKHQLAWSRFDLGLGKPRYYRQLLSLAKLDSQNAVLVARSTDHGPKLAGDAILAYTLDPNGEVFYWQDNCLHWHHICCTPGASLLPRLLDRWLINVIRCCGLDSTERGTYRDEAEQMQSWLNSTNPESLIRYR